MNMFLQPWVGSRSDRTHTRFGRRKPWLMLDAPLAAFFFILVPFVRENFVLIALAILGTNLGMALFRSLTVAYLGDLFKPGERSKANGVINLMGGAARWRCSSAVRSTRSGCRCRSSSARASC